MRKVVCQHVVDGVRQELIFDDWKWEYVESNSANETLESKALTPNAACEYFDSRHSDSHERPLELAFHGNFPEPFPISAGEEKFQFNPKGWTLYGYVEEQRGFTGDSYAVTERRWVFAANGKWIELSCSYYCEVNFVPDPTLRSLSKTQVADLLIANGYELPKELVGCSTIRPLPPLPLLTPEALETLKMPEQDVPVEERNRDLFKRFVDLFSAAAPQETDASGADNVSGHQDFRSESRIPETAGDEIPATLAAQAEGTAPAATKVPRPRPNTKDNAMLILFRETPEATGWTSKRVGMAIDETAENVRKSPIWKARQVINGAEQASRMDRHREL